MAGEMKHAAAGTSLSSAEYHSVTTHRFDGATAGDMGYDNGTSFVRLAIGTAQGQIMTVASGGVAPEWFDGLILTNDGTKTTILGKTGDYNRFGDAATTSHGLASEDDLMVTGKLEVTGVFHPNAMTLGGTLDISDEILTGASKIMTSGTTSRVLLLGGGATGGKGAMLGFYGYQHGSEPDEIIFFTANAAHDTDIKRLAISGGGTEVSAVWTNITHQGLKLGGALTLNGQVFDAGSESALITTTGSRKGLEITGSNSAHGVQILLRQSHTTPDLNSTIGRTNFYAFDHDGTPAERRFGMFTLSHSNIGDGTEEATYEWWGMAAGNPDNLAMSLTGAGLAWFDVGVDVDNYYKVAGTQVVSAQGAAVANPTDAASTQARLIDLLGRLRTHGLIAT